MAESDSTGAWAASRGQTFPTTHWSVVLAAGDASSARAREALETLCRVYWYPLYGYVRERGYAPAEAQDLTQDFFARFLERECFKQADPERGKFRTFLLTCLQRFIVSHWRK